jgi:hypothetical protein
MTKTASLDHLHASIEPLRRHLLHRLLSEAPSLAKRKRWVQEVGELTLLEAEMALHRHYLAQAAAGCAHGEAGTTPADWDEFADGVAYDARQEVLKDLTALRGGALSPGLLRYIDQLPGQSSRSDDETVEYVRAVSMLLPSDPFASMTDADAREHVQGRYFENLEATPFATTYADDVTHARQLTVDGGDLGHVRALLV